MVERAAQELVDVDDAVAAKPLPSFLLRHHQALLKAVEVHHAQIAGVGRLQVARDVAREEPVALDAVRACAVALAQLHVVGEQIGQAGASDRAVGGEVSSPRLGERLGFLFGCRVRKSLVRANCLAVERAPEIQAAFPDAVSAALDLYAHHDHSLFPRILQGQPSSVQSAQSKGSFLMLNSMIRYLNANRTSRRRA